MTSRSSRRLVPRAARGSALITVVFLAGIMASLTAAALKYTVSERRANERQRLMLRARNMVENVSVYSAEQLTTKLMRLRVFTPRKFTSGVNRIFLPPDSVLTTSYSTPADVEVLAGLTATSSMNLITDTSNPNYGLSVSTSKVPIIAKSTMRHTAVGEVTTYSLHDMEVAMIPVFQFGIFYNMDLEFFPGQTMTISGPVHTNGRLMARGEAGGSAILSFRDRITAAEGLFADGQMKANYRRRDGSNPSDAGGTGAVYYFNTAGSSVNLYGSHLGSNKWRDHKMGGANETQTTKLQFKTFSLTTYTGNVRTNVHGVTKLQLPSIGNYKETNDPNTPEDDRNNGRQIIEAPAPGDSSGIKLAKIGRQAGLYIVVNPDSVTRIGRLPDGTNVTMLSRSYRCFLNRVSVDGTQVFDEIVLPGQPSYGYNNNGTPGDLTDDTMYQNIMPNRFTDKTSVGTNQVLRIPASGRACDDPVSTVFATAGTTTGYSGATRPTFPTLTDSYFYDMRRAGNNSGFPYNRSTNAYTPRAIAKIDFHHTRFKMAVERSLLGFTGSTIYYPSLPTTAGQWGNFVYNPAASRGGYLLGINFGGLTDFSGFPTSATAAPANYWADPFRIYYAPANNAVAAITTDPNTLAVAPSTLQSAWYEGIAVYVHSVDAEERVLASGIPQRVFSGVRLWNGRGPLVSRTGTDVTGFTFATNDAAYIVGHYNADGTINSNQNATGFGGYSAAYPDSASEKLVSVIADAITILSQPTFTSNSGYYQTGGWSDGFSAHSVQTASAYSSSWQSTNPSSSNQYDGINTSRRHAVMPNLAAAGALGSAFTVKPDPVTTEISCALLMGLVPSNHNPTGLTNGPPSAAANQQYSGGAHNFPRMLEPWNSYDLYIRGSMVALYESRVAMEPWNLRVYNAPNRHWGLHNDLRSPTHEIPLEPIVLNGRRMSYRELSKAEYDTMRTTIAALPE